MSLHLHLQITTSGHPKNMFVSDHIGRNNGTRYRMVNCVVKENISACTCPNQRMNKVFIVVKYKVFIVVKFFDHALVSGILGLAWFTLSIWPPMPAKKEDCVLFLNIFAKKNYLVRNRITRAKIIYINKKIKKLLLWQSYIKFLTA